VNSTPASPFPPLVDTHLQRADGPPTSEGTYRSLLSQVRRLLTAANALALQKHSGYANRRKIDVSRSVKSAESTGTCWKPQCHQAKCQRKQSAISSSQQ
jgi:hypothetical protein